MLPTLRQCPLNLQEFETSYSVKTLVISNPNHLMQFLTYNPAELLNYDIESLHFKWKKNRIPPEILNYIELRGVVPNSNMNSLRVQHGQLPAYLRNYISEQ